jgi:hypothetical protein
VSERGSIIKSVLPWKEKRAKEEEFVQERGEGGCGVAEKRVGRNEWMDTGEERNRATSPAQTPGAPFLSDALRPICTIADL